MAIIATALAMLMAETMVRSRFGRLSPAQRVFLFVCGGNTSRSPMAQAICNAEIARRLGLDVAGLAGGPAVALSAGLTATPGRPLTAPSIAALGRLGVAPHDHASQEVTAELVGRAEAIFCMTEDLRRDLVERFPRPPRSRAGWTPRPTSTTPVGRGRTRITPSGNNCAD